MDKIHQEIAKKLLGSIRDKNAGGLNYYNSLGEFYNSVERKELVAKFFEYITNGSVRDPEHNILNLQ